MRILEVNADTLIEVVVRSPGARFDYEGCTRIDDAFLGSDRDATNARW
jgi:hypothetical protein